MASIETKIGGQSYILKGDGSEEHLCEVASIVQKKIDTLLRDKPQLSLQKATIITALDLASLLLKDRKKTSDYRSEVLSKAHHLLQRVESELGTH